MTDYVKVTDFAIKDSLLSGNPAKIIKGVEIDTEFNDIQTAIATKADSGDIPSLTGYVKSNEANSWTAAQTFGDGYVKLSGATSGSQTLKAAAIASTYTATLPAVTGTLAALNLAQSWTADQTFTETTETTYSLSGTDIDPVNGAIQYKTISGTTTFTATNFAAGQVVVLALTTGGSHTVNWPTVTWVTSTGNANPTLTAYDTVVFWKIATTLYAAYIGSGE